jgi:hypothetical protein
MKRLAIPLLVIAPVGSTVFLQATIVQDRSGTGQLLWHDDEAFLFVEGGNAGWKTNYFWLAVSSLSIYGPGATDGRSSMSVFRITPGSVERRRFEGVRPPPLIAFDGYVSSGGARWTGDGFDTTRPREVPASFTGPALWEFSDIGGWSKRSFDIWQNGTHPIEFRLGGQRLVLLPSYDGRVDFIDLQQPLTHRHDTLV